MSEYRIRGRATSVVVIAKTTFGPLITETSIVDFITFAANQYALRAGKLPYGLDG